VSAILIHDTLQTG